MSEVSVAVYQPRYFPRLHYIARANQADVFVIYDDVEFSRQSPQHRAKIDFGGLEWMTIPVKHTGNETDIKEAEIDMSQRWAKKHLNTIRAKYGGNCADEFETFYDNLSDSPLLVELTIPILYEVFERFGVDSTILRSSQMDAEYSGDPSQYLAEIVEEVGGDTYVSGGTGYRNYLDEEPFDDRGISVTVQDWEPKWEGGNVCCLDVICSDEDSSDYAN